MHPVLSSRARLGAYAAGWALTGAALGVIIRTGGTTSLLHCAVFGACGAAVGFILFLPAYYLCRAIPLHGTPIRSLGPTFLAASALLGLAWSGSVLGLLTLMARNSKDLLSLRLLLNLGGLGFFLSALVLALYYLLIAQDRALEAQAILQEQRVLAREAELKALRAQLNPHFLFNSLNSISALTTIDPKRAREMCVLLADFLRKSLKLGEQEWVTLADETDLLRAYLSIEKIRFGTRLQVQWDIDPQTHAQPIPPLLLQPLVENAIKHGIAQVPEGGTIRIATRRTPSLTEILVENPTDPDAVPPVGLGMGLRQVRSRLAGRFGDAIRFEAGTVEECHRVLMSFPHAPLESRHD